MSTCCECCVLSGRGLCDALITLPEKSYRLWSVAVCDLETSRMRRPWPTLGRNATEKKSVHVNITSHWFKICRSRAGKCNKMTRQTVCEWKIVLLFLSLHVGITAHLFVAVVIYCIIARYQYNIKIHYVSSYYSVLFVSNFSTMLVIQYLHMKCK
jgi:hypothetical protein